MNNRTFAMAGIFALASVTLAGCGGGGGGGGTPPSAQPPTGDLAAQAALVSGYQAFQGGVNYPFAQVQATLPTGSPLKAAFRAALAAASQVRSHAAATAHAGPAADGIGLYEADSTSGNKETLTFYTDAAETQSAGTLTVTQTSPAVTTINPGTYTSYPVAFAIAANVTAGPLPITGSGTIALTDSGGAGEIKGTFTLPASSVSATADLTLSDSGAIGGTATVTENGQTLTLTGLSGTLSGPITGSVTVAPGGDTGTATLNIAAGTFAVTLHTPTGTATASNDSGGNLDIALPSGASETISSPLTASPTAPITATLTGTVIAGTSSQAAGDTVDFDGNSALSVVTNSQGQFTLTLPLSDVTGHDTLTVFSSQGVLLQTQSITTFTPVTITLPTVPTPPTNLGTG